MVIAGPAEGWVDDLAGRKVGLTSGMPTLLLEDLLVAMRTFSPNANLNTWVAVSIDPTADGIENLNEFQKKIPSRIPMNARERVMHQLAEGLRDSLGLAKIAIYGVPRQSHLAQVMVEADYRMKLMAVGMEIKPIEMTTFIDALQGAPRHMQRWWLTPDYQCLKVAADGLSVEMIGRTVELKTENIDFDRNARIVRSKTKPSCKRIRKILYGQLRATFSSPSHLCTAAKRGGCFSGSRLDEKEQCISKIWLDSNIVF